MQSSFFFLIFLYNFILYYFYKQISKIYNVFDFPDFKRKLHKKKIPLLGGLYVTLNLFLIFLLNFFYIEIFNNNYFKNIDSFISFFIGAFFIYLLGFFDDKYKLKANSKLFIINSNEFTSGFFWFNIFFNTAFIKYFVIFA